MGAQRIPLDPDTGIPDLVHRLSDDSKRLMNDEIRLAKLEMKDDLMRGAKGAMYLAIAFAFGVALILAFTVFVATLIGRFVAGHMWLGTLIAGVLDLVIGGILVKMGVSAYTEPSYSFEETRATLH